MNIEFHDKEYERLAFDSSYLGKRSPALVRAYRKRINQILQAPNRRALYSFRSLRIERLRGKLKHQHSMRINDQFRLIFELSKTDGKEAIVVIKIEDYH